MPQTGRPTLKAKPRHVHLPEQSSVLPTRAVKTSSVTGVLGGVCIGPEMTLATPCDLGGVSARCGRGWMKALLGWCIPRMLLSEMRP